MELLARVDAEAAERQAEYDGKYLSECEDTHLCLTSFLLERVEKPVAAVKTAPAKAQSRPPPTQCPVHAGGLRAFPAANSFAGQGFSTRSKKGSPP
jgi:hypothetical protein